MKPGFVSQSYSGRYGLDILYQVFVPAAYDASTPVPAILFLHGAGENGTDGVRQTEVGLGPHIARRESLPFLVVFPQSQRGGWRARGEEAKRAIDILEAVIDSYNIDQDRIHLTGISMGGYGTWELAAAHPEQWASIAPVCGGGDPMDAPRIARLPCWAFHGAADGVIPPSASREMVDAVTAAGGHPRYTEFPGVGHNSWDPAYSMDELYDWWFAQRRRL